MLVVISTKIEAIKSKESGLFGGSICWAIRVHTIVTSVRITILSLIPAIVALLSFIFLPVVERCNSVRFAVT